MCIRDSGLRENTLIAEDSCPVCRLTEPQTVRLEHLYDVLYNELTLSLIHI